MTECKSKQDEIVLKRTKINKKRNSSRVKIELRTVSNNISTMGNYQTPKADPDFQRFFCYKQKQQQSNEERSFQVRIVKYFVVKLKKNEEKAISI